MHTNHTGPAGLLKDRPARAAGPLWKLHAYRWSIRASNEFCEGCSHGL